MYPRDLFKVIVKVLGLFVVKDIFMSLPYLVTPLLTLFGGESYGAGTSGIIFTTVILLFYFYIAYMMLFKTSSIVNFLKIEQDFLDDPITFEISTRNVVVISLIVLSGLILIEEIPNFCNQAFNYYQQAQTKFPSERPSVSKLLIPGVKILLAFLIIGERSRIIQLVLKDQKPKEEI